MEADGAIFQSDSDSEIFLHLIVRNMAMMTVEDSIIAACKVVKGAYSLLILVDGVLMAIRDPRGFRPLSLGRYNASWVVASETCAFDLLEAEYLRTLEPGEFVIGENGAVRARTLEQRVPPRQCIFELVYFARPDSVIFGENVYLCRKAMGRILAGEAPVEADFVMPFPDSGIYCAVGYAQASGLPYEHALIRNHYVGRTFIQPTQDMRDFSVRVKINPVREVIEGKRIVIVDDSIVRGTTMRTRVKKLRELGAREVHCRVSCPPVVYPCFYGVDFADPRELLAANHSLEDIRRMLDLDSLHFLSPEGLLAAVKEPDAYCTACFCGEYCVPPEDRLSGACCGAGEA
jgi:amidophosphoribosyltransferase